MPYDQFVKAQLAGDCWIRKTRYKTLPATGFLGLGPWYYDNGSVEVTRADERHDRVDVVTRGFLGLTVACARCHDHKYDPIPQTDYYSLGRRLPEHDLSRIPAWRRRRLSTNTRRWKKRSRRSRRCCRRCRPTLGTQLSESLAFQTSNYLQGVYEVAGQKREAETVVETRKLDYELLERWITYMGKPTDKYKYKEAWQAMMKTALAAAGGGRGRRMAAVVVAGAAVGGGAWRTAARRWRRRCRRQRRSQEAGRRVPGERGQGDARAQGSRRRERGHRRQGARRHQEKEARQQAQRVHHQRRFLSRTAACG